MCPLKRELGDVVVADEIVVAARGQGGGEVNLGSWWVVIRVGGW